MSEDPNYVVFRNAEKSAAAPAEYVISGPIGAYMNHIRWLMLVSNDVSLCEHILNKVYPNHRTAFSWLGYEWRFRLASEYNALFAVYHWPPDIVKDKPNLKKLLFINSTPENCLKHYLKINPTLNGCDALQFCSDITHTINHQNQIKKDYSHIDILTIDAEILDNPVLNIDLYNTITSFFDIDANYEVAARIHEQWYSLNKKAEEQMKSLPSSIEDFPWTSATVYPRLTNQEDYDKLLELMKEIYK